MDGGGGGGGRGREQGDEDCGGGIGEKPELGGSGSRLECVAVGELVDVKDW